MKLNSLDEYRCTCGKLLFRAHLIASVVEIKCKRCGTVRTFFSKDKDIPVSFSATIDPSGKITNACGVALWQQNFLKKLSPRLNTTATKQFLTKESIEFYLLRQESSGNYRVFGRMFPREN